MLNNWLWRRENWDNFRVLCWDFRVLYLCGSAVSRSSRAVREATRKTRISYYVCCEFCKGEAIPHVKDRWEPLSMEAGERCPANQRNPGVSVSHFSMTWAWVLGEAAHSSQQSSFWRLDSSPASALSPVVPARVCVPSQFQDLRIFTDDSMVLNLAGVWFPIRAALGADCSSGPP